MASANDLIVVTGASGKQSGGLIPLLYAKYQLRLVANSSGSVEKLKKQYPDADVVQADLCLPPDCARVVAGASTVYAMAPPLHEHEKELSLFLIDAAVAEAAKPDSKFRHYVLSSVLNTQLRRMANHDDKRYVEEYLIESLLNFTILKPGDFFQQTFYPKEWSQSADPKYLGMINWDIVSSCVFLEDLSEASAKVIEERDRHFGAEYMLVSRGPATYRSMVEECAAILGKPIGFEYLPLEKRFETALVYTYGSVDDAPARVRDKAERMILFYDRRGIIGNPNVLEWLLGRKPTTMEEFVKKSLAQA